MRRPTVRRLSHLFAASALGLALVLPSIAIAADPGSPSTSEPTAAEPSDAPTDQPSGGTVELDPTFIASPTATPAGAILGATGRPRPTPPPTDAGSQRPTASTSQGLPILLAILATICLAGARLPDVRRR